MSDGNSAVVQDLVSFCKFVEQGRVGVGWTVYPDIGPEWVGSRREITFYVDRMRVVENPTIASLVKLLVEGLEIPATSSDHVICGEGELSKNGSAIELSYDWYESIPYDAPVKTGGGIFILMQSIGPEVRT